MRRRAAATAAVLLVLALYLLANPTTADMLAKTMGVADYATSYAKTDVVSIPPLNFSSFSVSVPSGGWSSVSLTANPGGIDVLVMNQGNFTLWSEGIGDHQSAYGQSRLSVSNYTFAVAHPAGGQYFVVLVSHSALQATQVLVHTVVAAPSELENLLLPLVLGPLGLILMAYALGGRARKSAGGSSAGGPRDAPLVEGSSFSHGASCGHCGAAIETTASFCPSCGRSRV